MANKVKHKKGTFSSKTFTVEGKTLEEIWESLKKNKQKSSDVVGAVNAVIDIPAFKSADFDEEDDDYVPGKKDGEVGIAVTAKSGEVTVSGTIILPSLKSDKDLSDAAKKEWARFLKELSAHEDLHVEAAVGVAKEIAEELSNLVGQGKGKDKKAARKAAEDDFAKKFKKDYEGTKTAKRVQEAHDDLDKKGNTFTLNTDIE